ncbi:MAG TPA: rRNA maturation RNase YbeY [Verrucomicrobiae bacterium]
MNIVIASRQRKKKINAPLLKQITGALLAELKITEAELGINLVGACEMTLINETFLQHTGSTDVITFDHSILGQRTPDAGQQLHGELFICVDDAISQAKHFKTTWQSEVVRYLVHGVLHLLGHDDGKPPSRRKMKRAENRRLRSVAQKFSLAQIGTRSKISM